jgi:peptidoglycan/xylan/chitin deacetylase (PgdA/CDA1 family)
MFGEDTQILNAVKLAVESGTEVGAHGWKHENLTKLEFWEQLHVLFQAKKIINELLDVELKLLIPPSFSFNDDTIYAMHEQSYNIISTCVDYHKPSDFPEVRGLPATVELSIIEDGIWKMKNNKSIIEEVELSLKKYGYAAIVTHPQEFIRNGTLDDNSLNSFVSLINNLRETFQFTTFEKLESLIY